MKTNDFPPCYPVQQMHEQPDDMKTWCLLLLFMAMGDRVREDFLKEAGKECSDVPTEI